MRTPRLKWAGVLLAMFTMLPAVALAQAATTGQDATLAELRDRIEDRYQVLPVREGVVLMPKYRGAEIQAIELSNGGIAIDGTPVTGAELRERIGDGDADDVMRLSFMEASTRRVLFGIGPPPVVGPPTGDEAVGAGTDAAAAVGDDSGEPLPKDGGEGTTWISEEGDQVRVGGSVVVPAGRYVDGDVVAVAGSVTVEGHVTGDVVAVGGSVELGPEAIVEGEVTAVGGSVQRAPGAEIRGNVQEVGWFGDLDIDPDIRPFNPFQRFANLVFAVMVIAILALFAALAFLLGRTPIERMEYRVRTSPWKAAAVGLLGWILLIPVIVLTCVVLAVSIIGIPLLLAVPFALVALKIGILLGFVAVAKSVGHGAETRFGWHHENAYLSVLVGVGILTVPILLGAALSAAGGPFGIFGFIVGLLGWIGVFAAWTTGFGAFLLTRFGTRYRWDGGGPQPAAPAPAPAETPSV